MDSHRVKQVFLASTLSGFLLGAGLFACQRGGPGGETSTQPSGAPAQGGNAPSSMTPGTTTFQQDTSTGTPSR
jgi:hypothetical protein